MILTALSEAADRLSRSSDSPRLDAELLLCHVLGCNRAQLRGRDDQRLDMPAAASFERLIARRCEGEPVAYLLGYREFWNSRFLVQPGILVPRPETELLVETTLRWIASMRNPQILDLGTGSGAIGLSVALERPDADVTLVDKSPIAITVATQNRDALSARARILEGSWFTPVRGEFFDVILSNPPYIAAGDTHLERHVLRHEPSEALIASEDGLGDLRTIIEQAHRHLRPHGRLLVEHGFGQAEPVRNLLNIHGFRQIDTFPDLAGLERATGGVFGD